MTMTHHREDQGEDHDPDFDKSTNEEVMSKDMLEQKTPSAPVTISFSMTPKKIFFSGLGLGLIIMAIPAVFFAARGMSDGTALAGTSGNGNTIAVAPTDTQPSANAPAPTPGKVKPVGKDDYVFGDKNAKVTLIEYSDLECPFCKRFHPTVKQALDEYKGKVNWVYRHFPLSFHANAQKEEEALECAGELGGSKKYYEYLNTVMDRTTSNGTGFALDQLVPLAKELKLNEGKFKACLDSGKYAAKVKQSETEGQAAGVDGTPGSILVTKDGKSALIPGAVPYADLKVEIDRLLQ